MCCGVSVEPFRIKVDLICTVSLITMSLSCVSGLVINNTYRYERLLLSEHLNFKSTGK